MLIGAAFNMIFDPIFIFVFKWGIAGAAWATILGQMLSFIVAALYLRKFKTAPIKKQHLKISGANLLQIARLGIAACFNQLALLVVQITLNNSLRYYGALSQYGSEIPLASTGIIMKVNMIFFSIAIGIAQGCQPINGYNYGAKNYARVAQTLKTALLSATAILSIGFVLFQLFPREIISIFGDGSEEYFIFAERFFRIFLFATFLNGIHPITSNFFTSIGKASRGMLMSLTRQVLFLVPLILILPIFYGIDGIMYAGPIADVAAALLGGYLIRKELKNMKQLEAQEEASNLLQTPIQS
jgi:Na+-driven multidrug efflux pump